MNVSISSYERVPLLKTALEIYYGFIPGLLLLIFCGIFLKVKDIYELRVNQTVHISALKLVDSFVQSNISRTEDVVASKNKELKQILFYDPTMFQMNRNILNISYFQNCKVNDCEMTFNKVALNNSDAVIFHLWHHLWNELKYPIFERPHGQVWILIQHEATERYEWPSPFYRNNFNWTMTYSDLSDIYLPYGKLRRLSPETKIKRDYLEIARRKSKDPLWIVSHCPTSSQRLEYAKILENYITLDILGKCGRKWRCGTRYHHDKCFDILNSTYRYYLAFENNFCQEYITEKFFENYKYDIIQVVRGGNPKTRPVMISHDAYISASDFSNAHELGAYLRALSNDTVKYAKMLETKDEYQPIAYSELFQQSMCEICKRLHNIHKYRFVYDDVYQWIKTNEPCFNNQTT